MAGWPIIMTEANLLNGKADLTSVFKARERGRRRYYVCTFACPFIGEEKRRQRERETKRMCEREGRKGKRN